MQSINATNHETEQDIFFSSHADFVHITVNGRDTTLTNFLATFLRAYKAAVAARYTKTETDTLLTAVKASIGNCYTKGEVIQEIKKALDAMTSNFHPSNGKYAQWWEQNADGTWFLRSERFVDIDDDH